MRIILREIAVSPQEGIEGALQRAARETGGLENAKILHESIDARGRVLLKYTIQAEVSERVGNRLLGKGTAVLAKKEPPLEFPRGSRPAQGRTVVVGAGPCGLFAAWLLAREGMRPLLIERGEAIEARAKTMDTLRETGVLNEESNICFGEGGAGAFSDGKLTSRSKDPLSKEVLRLLVSCGAPEKILYAAKPHLGTDNLQKIVGNLRREILRLGGEIRFGTKLTGMILQKEGRLRAIVCPSETIEANCCLLAIGGSARDTYQMLIETGVAAEPKPFAVGVRAEHRREMIDLRQYGAAAEYLGAADYRLTAKCAGRGVYSFCVCPGGEVVCSATEAEHTAVNGMSYYARDLENTCGAIVVSVSPQDYPAGALGGIELQRWCEAAAYRAAGGYGAPVQRFKDFSAGVSSAAFGNVKPSYRPYTVKENLNDCLPPFVCSALAEGISSFEKSIPGFAKEALLTGVETRTSSPVRLSRREDGQSATIPGLYPAGEGAGYAGGIVSAAIDGLRAAQKILAAYANPKE